MMVLSSGENKTKHVSIVGIRTDTSPEATDETDMCNVHILARQIHSLQYIFDPINQSNFRTLSNFNHPPPPNRITRGQQNYPRMLYFNTLCIIKLYSKGLPHGILYSRPQAVRLMDSH